VRLEEENKRLQSTVMRLEAENEMLANEVGTCQITAQDRIEQMDIKLSKASRENARLQALLGRVQSEAAEDKERLELEASQVKTMYRTVVEESDQVAAELKNETRRFEIERVRWHPALARRWCIAVDLSLVIPALARRCRL